MTTAYDTLGVAPSASQEEIKQAFRALAVKHHPDHNPGDAGAEERFKEINEAHQQLKDPSRRRLYDYDCGIRHRGFGGAPPIYGTGLGDIVSAFNHVFFSQSGVPLSDLFEEAQRARQQRRTHRTAASFVRDMFREQDEAAGRQGQSEGAHAYNMYQANGVRRLAVSKALREYAEEAKKAWTSKGCLGGRDYYEWRVTTNPKVAVRLIGPHDEAPNEILVQTVVGPGGTETLVNEVFLMPEDPRRGFHCNSKSRGWKLQLADLARAQFVAIKDAPKCPKCSGPMYKDGVMSTPDGAYWLCVRTLLYSCQGARRRDGTEEKL